MTLPDPLPKPVRHELPHRRVSYTKRVQLPRKPTFFLTIGIDAAGRPMEVFADGWRDGSDIQVIVRDACIVISLALQHGLPLDGLLHSMNRVPCWTPQGDGETWASEIGAILAEIKSSSEAGFPVDSAPDTA